MTTIQLYVRDAIIHVLLVLHHLLVILVMQLWEELMILTLIIVYVRMEHMMILFRRNAFHAPIIVQPVILVYALLVHLQEL